LSPFAVKFIALALKFVVLAIEFNMLVIEVGMFVSELVAFAQIFKGEGYSLLICHPLVILDLAYKWGEHSMNVVCDLKEQPQEAGGFFNFKALKRLKIDLKNAKIINANLYYVQLFPQDI